MSELRLDLPEQIVNQCEEIVEETEFDSVEEYLKFIIMEVAKTSEDGISDSEDVDQRDMDEQLEALGYK